MLQPPINLMTAIADCDNCTIEFDNESAVTTDSNGFSIISSTPEQLRARVYNDGSNNKDAFPAGIDLEGELLWGRLHNPVAFPSTIKDLSLVRLIFDDGRSGTARIKIKTQNPLMGNTPAIGQKFSLLFRAN